MIFFLLLKVFQSDYELPLILEINHGMRKDSIQGRLEVRNMNESPKFWRGRFYPTCHSGWYNIYIWFSLSWREPAKHRPSTVNVSLQRPGQTQSMGPFHLVTSGVDMAMTGPLGHRRLPLYGTPPTHRRRQSRPELPCIVSLYLHVWGFQLPTISFS